jgi:hypothetical protein
MTLYPLGDCARKNIGNRFSSILNILDAPIIALLKTTSYLKITYWPNAAFNLYQHLDMLEVVLSPFLPKIGGIFDKRAQNLHFEMANKINAQCR